jgi:hypothetical protein
VILNPDGASTDRVEIDLVANECGVIAGKESAMNGEVTLKSVAHLANDRAGIGRTSSERILAEGTWSGGGEANILLLAVIAVQANEIFGSWLCVLRLISAENRRRTQKRANFSGDPRSKQHCAFAGLCPHAAQDSCTADGLQPNPRHSAWDPSQVAGVGSSIQTAPRCRILDLVDEGTVQDCAYVM